MIDWHKVSDEEFKKFDVILANVEGDTATLLYGKQHLERIVRTGKTKNMYCVTFRCSSDDDIHALAARVLALRGRLDWTGPEAQP